MLEKDGLCSSQGSVLSPEHPRFEKHRHKRLFRAATSSLLCDGAKSTVSTQSHKEKEISSMFGSYKRGHKSLSAQRFNQLDYLRFGTSAKLFSQLLEGLKLVTMFTLKQSKPFSFTKS